jgi:hypothetical protein
MCDTGIFNGGRILRDNLYTWRYKVIEKLNRDRILNELHKQEYLRKLHQTIKEGLIGTLRQEYFMSKPSVTDYKQHNENVERFVNMPILHAVVDMMTANLIHSTSEKLVHEILNVIDYLNKKEDAEKVERCPDNIFIEHIQAHLPPDQEVICKICGKTAREITGMVLGNPYADPLESIRLYWERKVAEKDLIIAQLMEERKTSAMGEEIVICSAIKMASGEIYRGHRHGDCILGLNREHKDKVEWSGHTQGFITSKNRFVSREEGRKLQDAAGIKSVDKEGYRGDTLFSEDLY